MAAGDLILGEQSQGDGSLIGYATGVSVAVPASGTTTIVSNDTASWVAAVETANERVISAAGLTFAPSSEVTFAAGVQAYCADGAFTLDGDAIGGTEFLTAIEDDQFIGNMIIEPSIGLAGQGNNPGVGLEMAWLKSSSDTKGIYLFYVELHPDPLIASMSGDRPEGFQAWMKDTAYTRLITMHGCSLPAAHELSNSKYMSVGSTVTDGASGIFLTWYRNYAYVWRRFPLLGDAANFDMMNCVIPDMVARRETAVISRDSNTKTDLRANYVYGNEILTQSEVQDNSSGSVYYPTSGGAGNDDNFEVNSPTIDLNPAQPSLQLGAYTGKPVSAAMDGTLQTTIEAEGAGTHAITQETPPDTLDPISAGHAAWNTLHNKIPGMFFTKLEPYERQFRELIEYNHFYRWNNAAKCLVKEWTADPSFPGLNPHAARGMVYVPAFTGGY